MKAAYSLGNVIDQAIEDTGWSLGEIIADLINQGVDLTNATNNEWIKAIHTWTPDTGPDDTE